jgi:hypothetical protein
MLNKGQMSDERRNSFGGKNWEYPSPFQLSSKVLRRSSENNLNEERVSYNMRKYSDNRNINVK